MSRIIWLLTSNRWNSAITEYALSCAKALKLCGYEVVFTPLKDSPAEKRALEAGLKVESLKSFGLSDFFTAYKMKRALNPEKVIAFGGREATLCKVLFGSNFVRFFGQAIDYSERDIWRFYQRKNSLKQSNVLLVPSEYLAGRLADFYPGLDPKVIDLGLDETKFLVNAPKASRPKLLILGRLDPVKGHKEFFKVFKTALDLWQFEKPKPQLHVIGEAANTSVLELRQACLDLGLASGDVIFTDKRVEDISEEISTSTLGLVTSKGSEVICRVAEEFLLSGVPVFVSGVGSLKDVLFDGAGMCYAGLSDETAAELLVNTTILSSKESLEQRRTRRNKAVERYSLESMGRRLTSALGLA